MLKRGEGILKQSAGKDRGDRLVGGDDVQIAHHHRKLAASRRRLGNGGDSLGLPGALGIGRFLILILRFEMVDQQRHSFVASLDADVHLKAVTGEDSVGHQIAHVWDRVPDDVRLAGLKIVNVRADAQDLDVGSLLLDEQSDIDGPEVVAIQRQDAPEVVVEENVVEISQRVNVLDFLYNED